MEDEDYSIRVPFGSYGVDLVNDLWKDHLVQLLEAFPVLLFGSAMFVSVIPNFIFLK